MVFTANVCSQSRQIIVFPVSRKYEKHIFAISWNMYLLFSADNDVLQEFVVKREEQLRKKT